MTKNHRPADPMGRAEKYRAQCAIAGQKIEQKHISKLNLYSRDPDAHTQNAQNTKYHIKHGTQLVKKFRGREYIVIVSTTNQFSYNGKIYKTLSAIATEICGHKVSGYEFFGFNKSKL